MSTHGGGAAKAWTDALDSRGKIDWALFPFIRPAIPIQLPFPGTKDAFETGVNERFEAMAIDARETNRVPGRLERMLVAVGPM